ncbi:MAG: ImmA/IrrE family metallo-endopeptidase, partial [Angustibacter sp.]
TVGFLEHSSKVRGATAVDAHMRRQRTAPPTVWRRLESQLNMARMHSSHLLEDVTIRAQKTIPFFDPIDTSPQQAAQLVRTQWGLPIGPVINLVDWLEMAGCLIFTEDFGTHRVEGLSQWVDSQPIMLINSAAPIDKVRWTVAHELGHLVLHSNESSQAMEQEADDFAAEFLMPAHIICPQLRKLNLGRLRELKRTWRVPMAAIIDRAHVLGTLTAVERTALHKRRSAQGWLTREPGSDELGREEPKLPQAIAETLISRGLTVDDIASVTGFSNPTENTLFVPKRERQLRAL